jgi:alkylation response protein AidB-like acyl-CoA dehydrogenase
VPVAYGDAQGVRRVLARRLVAQLEARDAAVRTTAWTAASAGYLAGLGEWALETATGHARGRRAFGSTLAALAPVQQRLADAATATGGLSLLAHAAPGRAALAHAGAAAVEVTAACQQVVGAIGFTLEFPLQRAYRRARAVQLWADAFLEGTG